MIKEDKVICPKCKVKIECNGYIPTGTFWVDNEGIFNWECFECNYEWKGDFKRIKQKQEEIK